MVKRNFFVKWIIILFVGLIVSSFCVALNLTYASDSETTSIDIILEVGDYELSNMPNSIEGETYPIFDYSATDNLGNNVDDISVLVYFDEDGKTNIGSTADDKLVLISEGRFITDKEGVYVIEYVARKGRVSERERIYVKALAKEQYVAPQYFINENIPSSVEVGDKVFLLEGTLIEDVRYGKTNVTTKIIYEGQYSVQQIDVYKNEKDLDFFIPKVSGKYKICYSLENILGENKIISFEKEIDAKDVESPKIDMPVFDKVYFVGETVKFPTTQAIEYKGGEIYYVPVKVFVNNEEITSSMEYTFLSNGIYEIRYEAQNIFTENKSVIKQNVVVNDLSVSAEEMFVSKYLYVEGFEEVYIKDSLEYENNVFTLISPNEKREDTYVEFKRPILESMLNVSVGVETLKCNFEQLYVRFIDSENFDEQIEISFSEKIEKGVRTVLKYLNGKEVGAFNGKVFSGAGSVYSHTTFSLEYNKEDYTIIDDDGKKVFDLTSYFGGEVFKGFSSGKAYVQIGIKNNYEQSQIKLYSLAGTAISDSDKDKSKPVFLITDQTPQHIVAEYGEQVNIYKMPTFDLFDENVRVDVKITKTNGEVIVERTMEGDYLYKINSYDDLVIKYTAIDFAGNKREKKINLTVIDRVSPKVIVPQIASGYKVGQTLNVSDIVYTDNSGAECVVSCYIVEPSGDNQWLKDKVYTFKTKGEYKLNICVFDNDGNSTCIEFDIVCN